MNVHIANEQTLLEISLKSVEQAVKLLVKEEKIDCDELSVHLIDDKKISLLHEFYFNDPTSTDCISFPIDQPGQRDDGVCFLGEIFVSVETAKSYAKEHKTDPYKETLLYIVHGFLHLIGYDDIEENDEKLMRKKEKDCIEKLNKANISLIS